MWNPLDLDSSKSLIPNIGVTTNHLILIILIILIGVKVWRRSSVEALTRCNALSLVTKKAYQSKV